MLPAFIRNICRKKPSHREIKKAAAHFAKAVGCDANIVLEAHLAQRFHDSYLDLENPYQDLAYLFRHSSLSEAFIDSLDNKSGWNKNQIWNALERNQKYAIETVRHRVERLLNLTPEQRRLCPSIEATGVYL